MLSRGVQTALDKYGYDYPYENTAAIFLNDDFTVGNLECPITSFNNPVHKDKRFLFRADPQNASALKKAGFDCMILANNHSMDQDSRGLSDTMEYLKNNGIAFVGAGDNSGADFSYIFEKNGIKIGFLAYSIFPPEGYFYDASKADIQYTGIAKQEELGADLKKLDCDFKIVYFHWGVEYEPFINDKQRILGHKAIDSGADLVVGTHPHVIQPHEIYNGKYIFYSLGNFIFDKQIPKGTDETMILQITVNKHGIQGIHIIPALIKHSQVILSDNEAR